MNFPIVLRHKYLQRWISKIRYEANYSIGPFSLLIRKSKRKNYFPVDTKRKPINIGINKATLNWYYMYILICSIWYAAPPVTEVKKEDEPRIQVLDRFHLIIRTSIIWWIFRRIYRAYWVGSFVNFRVYLTAEGFNLISAFKSIFRCQTYEQLLMTLWIKKYSGISIWKEPYHVQYGRFTM